MRVTERINRRTGISVKRETNVLKDRSGTFPIGDTLPVNPVAPNANVRGRRHVHARVRIRADPARAQTGSEGKPGHPATARRPRGPDA